MTEYTHELETALDAASTAGKLIAKRRSQSRVIKYKGLRDIVTDADLAANTAIHSILKQEFPQHAILSEEDSRPEGSSDHADHLWIVDPLDGTTNFSRDYPVYSVSIALAEQGVVKVGVIFDPSRDECFYATRGGGAFLNGTRLAASRVAKLEDAVVGMELPRDQILRERNLHLFAQLAARSMTARIGGSAALSFCYIAAGRLDGYFHFSLSAWDVAAGLLIAREAGARVTHLDGRAATWRGGSYLAANRKFYPVLARAIKELATT